MINATACDLCLDSVKLIKDEVNLTNATIAAVSVLVKVSCAILATKTQDKECKYIVSKIDLILSKITQGFNNLQICSFLKIC